MRIYVTGSEGVVGKELLNRGCSPIKSDITDANMIYHEIINERPDVLIHCAALTDVTFCENHFKESFDVNVKGTLNVVEALPKNSLFIYLSSDHVFSGHNYFYEGYGEWHKPSPVNRYGFSKWGGELAATSGDHKVIIVRSSKLYNYAWAKPIIDRLNNEEEVEVTDLIKRSFYHVNHFVDNLLYLAEHYGEYPDLDIVNISGKSVFSYYMFWVIIQKQLGLDGKLKPRNHELKEETPRPFRGGLNTKQAQKLGIPIYSTKEGIDLLGAGV